ncbi:MAG: hypothetical protein HN730_07395 [Bdellovibrionales bacterium]|nr:hypothetical protein [Bdellovibrionales bacterium]
MNINRGVLIFMLSVAMMIFVIWQLIHTRQMANFISHEVTVELARRYDTKISFDAIDISIIPLATNLNNVHLNYKGKVLFNLNRIKIEFDFFDLLANRFSINRLLLSEGVISVPDFKQANSNSGNTFRWKSLGKTVRSYVDRYLPIRVDKISMNSVNFEIGNNHFWLEKFKCGIYRNVLSIQTRIGELNIGAVDFPLLKGDIDMVEFEGHITHNNIRIRKLAVKSQLEGVAFSGMLSDLNTIPLVEGKGHVYGRLGRFSEWSMVPTKFAFQGSGVAQFKIKKSSISTPSVSMGIKLAKLSSPQLGGWERANITTRIEQSQLILDQLVGELRRGKVELRESVVLFDFKHRASPSLDAGNLLHLQLHNVHTNDGLFFLNDKLSPLKGILDGNVTIGKEDKLIEVIIMPETKLTDFKLIFSPGDPTLLNPKLQFNRSAITHNLETGETKMKLDLEFINSRIQAEAKMDRNELFFMIQPAKIDLKAFGPISGVALDGTCDCQIEISGPYEEVKFKFDAKIKQFSVLDLKLGDVKSSLELDLNSLRLKISKLDALYRKSHFSADGYLQFETPSNLNLNIDMDKASLRDSLEIFSGILPNPHHVPTGMDFSYRSKFKISGGFSTDQLKVEGNLIGKDLLWSLSDRIECTNRTAICPELSLNTVESSFIFEQQTLQLENILLKGRSVELSGDLSYELEPGLFSYNAYLAHLSLRELASYNLINPGFDGMISGNFIGSNYTGSLVSDSVINILDARIGDKKLASSLIQIVSSKKKISLWGNMLGEMMVAEGLIDYSENGNGDSYFRGEINAEDLSIVAGLLSQHNILSDDLAGNIDATFDINFKVKQWAKLNADLDLNEFNVIFSGKDASLLQNSSSIQIIDGKIVNWDLKLDGSAGQITSSGEGHLDKKVKIDNRYNIDASLLNLLSPKIRVLSGRNSGKALLISKDGDVEIHLESSGKDMTIRVDKVKGVIEDLNYSLIMEDNLLMLKEANARYGNGLATLSGSVAFDFPFPVIDFDYKLKSIQLPLLDKSSIVLSGRGEVRGESFPYLIKGNHSIVHGEITGNIGELTKDEGGSMEGQRFIPSLGGGHRGLSIFRYDLGVTITDHIYIKNSMAELYLNGHTTIMGTSNVPQIKGEVGIKPQKSKLIFKGHEFILSEGVVTFKDNLIQEKPIVKLAGVAEVGNYRVDLNVDGKSDNLIIKFVSDPYLSHEDILSLLALGMTSETSQGLESSDRQSITSIGLGTLLVDQFQLGQELKSSLGLKLSVIPEWEKDETSLLKGRSSSSDSASTKLRSTTKIKVQKKLGRKLGMAVSSTVGGSMGQKHEMNLDYRLGRDVSLLGVYEIKAVEDSGAAESSSSAGIDLKFKWSFR